MPSLVFLTAGVALALLALHARALHGARVAAEFMALAFVYFVVKENLSVAGCFHVYYYAHEPAVRIFRAPLGVVIGWLFTSYLAWTIAERLLARFPASRGGFPHTVLVAMLVTAAISYPMEAVGTSLGWWSWTVDRVPWVIPPPADGSHAWVVIPPVPLIGWALFVGGFLFWWLAARTWAPRHLWLRVPIVAAGAALHFRAIHGVGEGPELGFAIELGLFFVALATMAPSAHPAGSMTSPDLAAAPAPVRRAVEVSLALMGSVVLALIATRIRDAEHLLTLAPLGLLLAAADPRVRRSVLAWGWGACWAIGILTASPKIFTVSFFPMGFFLGLGLRRLGGWVRRQVAGEAPLVAPSAPASSAIPARAPRP
ncbi:MAG: hypothetical protein IPK07_21795 [Deltaproteobacteria bacterium]|nr:hypothetical protein [Deltaproteobacteria bacterium]